jgi:crotonobetainyl-CoA:carnitine CoA-transferase CaiB-like acyl-CoA transferase
MTGSNQQMTATPNRKGPLAGIRIVELEGIGPAPMAAMLLADLGATIIRIERKQPVDLGVPRPARFNPHLRNRQSIALDLKNPAAVKTVLELVEQADGFIESFRPGVAERLGLGPDVCLARNPKLVYGRMTGWGQTGPLAQVAAHDINYIAITGALNAIGRKNQAPVTPLNLVGDFGGGSLYLVMGMLAAILSARENGEGQVVDAAIVDGASSLMSFTYGLYAGREYTDYTPERESNVSDGGAYFNDAYECKDGKYIALGPFEGKFHDEMLRRLEIDPAVIGPQMDKANWPRNKQIIAEKIRTRSRDEWTALLEGTDVCFAPVLDLEEAPRHPHNVARQTFIEVDGVIQPAPAPRFSRTVPETPTPPRPARETPPGEALRSWFDEATIARLRADGVID